MPECVLGSVTGEMVVKEVSKLKILSLDNVEVVCGWAGPLPFPVWMSTAGTMILRSPLPLLSSKVFKQPSSTSVLTLLVSSISFSSSLSAVCKQSLSSSFSDSGSESGSRDSNLSDAEQLERSPWLLFLCYTISSLFLSFIFISRNAPESSRESNSWNTVIIANSNSSLGCSVNVGAVVVTTPNKIVMTQRWEIEVVQLSIVYVLPCSSWTPLRRTITFSFILYWITISFYSSEQYWHIIIHPRRVYLGKICNTIYLDPRWRKSSCYFTVILLMRCHHRKGRNCKFWLGEGKIIRPQHTSISTRWGSH